MGSARARRLVDLWAQRESIAEGDEHRIPLEAFGYRWFRIGTLNYALERSTDVPTLETDVRDGHPAKTRERRATPRGEPRVAPGAKRASAARSEGAKKPPRSPSKKR